jgi:hypothetical protein
MEPEKIVLKFSNIMTVLRGTLAGRLDALAEWLSGLADRIAPREAVPRLNDYSYNVYSIKSPDGADSVTTATLTVQEKANTITWNPPY